MRDNIRNHAKELFPWKVRELNLIKFIIQLKIFSLRVSKPC